MLGYRVARVGHLDSRELLGCVELYGFAIILSQHLDERLIGLDINSAVTAGTGQNSGMGDGLVHLVIDELVIVGMMGQAKADGTHHGHKVQR